MLASIADADCWVREVAIIIAAFSMEYQITPKVGDIFLRPGVINHGILKGTLINKVEELCVHSCG